MTHLDDGQLHAYLDGEHGGLAAERHETDRHLAECAQCRARLEEARRVRDRARAILAAAGPQSLTPPPFEAVVERAARGKQTGRRVRTIRSLAWAASIALAVTAGWYARGLLTAGAGGTAGEIGKLAAKTEKDVRANPIEAAPPAARQVAQASQGQAEVAQRTREGASGTGTGVQAPPTANVAVAEAKAVTDSEAQPRTLAGAAAPSAAPAPSVAAPLDVTRRTEAATRQDGSITGRVVRANTQEPLAGVVVLVEGTPRQAVTGSDGRFELTDVPAGPQRLQAALVGYGAQRREVSVLGGGTATVDVAMEPATVALEEVVVTGMAGSWVTVSPGEAERRLGGPLATIPGLPSLGSAVSGTGAATVVRTIQVLGPGLTIELIQQRAVARERAARTRAPAAAAAQAEVAPRDAGAGQVTVEWEGFSVSGRALVPQDSLRKLLQRLTAAPPLR